MELAEKQEVDLWLEIRLPNQNNLYLPDQHALFLSAPDDHNTEHSTGHPSRQHV